MVLSITSPQSGRDTRPAHSYATRRMTDSGPGSPLLRPGTVPMESESPRQEFQLLLHAFGASEKVQRAHQIPQLGFMLPPFFVGANHYLDTVYYANLQQTEGSTVMMTSGLQVIETIVVPVGLAVDDLSAGLPTVLRSDRM